MKAVPLFILVGWVVALTGANPVSALPITFGFTGSVVEVTPSGPISPDEVAVVTSQGIVPGAVVSGSYTFESTAQSDTPGIYPGQPEVGQLRVGDFVTGLAAIAGTTFIVGDDRGPTGTLDTYAFLGISMTNPLPGFDFQIASLELRDPSGVGLSSEVLPLTPPDLALFTGLPGFPDHFFLHFNTPEQVFQAVDVAIRLDALFVVPEPATNSLVGLGLLLLAACRRRSRR